MKEKTLYEMILQKLGVEDGDRFNIIKQDGEPSKYNPCHFEDGFLMDKEDDFNENDFFDLLLGKATIEKLPWKPKDGDTVYCVNPNGHIFSKTFSYSVTNDLARLKCKWFFKSYYEAEANVDRIIAEMKEVVEDGTD